MRYFEREWHVYRFLLKNFRGGGSFLIFAFFHDFSKKLSKKYSAKGAMKFRN